MFIMRHKAAAALTISKHHSNNNLCLLISIILVYRGEFGFIGASIWRLFVDIVLN